MAKKGSENYEVGYGKPPKGSQFQKGQSGNRSGRPKQPASMATLLRKELNRRVTITENGKTRSITLQEAALRQISTKAAKGDIKSLQILMSLRHYIEIPPIAMTHADLNDQAVFDAAVARMGTMPPENNA